MTEAPQPDFFPEATEDPTSRFVRNARAGHGASQAWIVNRFTPAILVSARWHLSGHSYQVCEAEDLVQEVWAIGIARLRDLEPRDGRYTPVLLKFLNSILLNVYRNVLRKQIRWRQQNPESSDSGFKADFFGELPAETSGTLTKTIRNEEQARLQKCVDGLSKSDREVVILRGIEQLPNKEVAVLLGEAPDTVSARDRRALEKLRKALPGSIFDELT